MAKKDDIKKIRQNMLASNQKKFKNEKTKKWIEFNDSDCIDIIDYTDEILEQIKTALHKALVIIGLKAEGYAKRLCPVDTGRLRNSITNTVDLEENAAYIGTNVEYAEPVEMGHGKVKARPYLRPAAQDHMKEYRDILEQTLSED